LGEIGRVVDQRVQLAMIEPLLDLADSFERVCQGQREIDLDVVLRPPPPMGQFSGKRVTRTGDHAPAGG